MVLVDMGVDALSVEATFASGLIHARLKVKKVFDDFHLFVDQPFHIVMNDADNVERQLTEISLLEAMYPAEFIWIQKDPSKVPNQEFPC